jgi:hypothetical protein
MCNVSINNITDRQDINFLIYNTILSIGQNEFTAEEVEEKLSPLGLEVSIDDINKLIKGWTKSGIIEDQVNSYALSDF